MGAIRSSLFLSKFCQRPPTDAPHQTWADNICRAAIIVVVWGLCTATLIATVNTYTTTPVFLLLTGMTIAITLLGGSAAGVISLAASVVVFRYFYGPFNPAVQQRLFANVCVDTTFIGLIAYLRFERENVKLANAARVAELEAERARWKRVVEGIADEVWVCDLQGRMSLVNLPTVTKMNLQEFKDHTIAQVMQHVDIFTPEGKPRPPENSPLLRVLRGEQHVQGEEIMRAGSTERWRQFSAAPIYTDEGRIGGAVAVVRDITEQKRMEQALIVTEKLVATGRLAATIAHEINNPLAAMTNIMYLLRSSIPNEPTAQTYVKLLDEQIKSITRITAQTLKFARDNGRPTEFTLRELISDVTSLYAHEAKKREITIEQRVECDGGFVGYKSELVQVVSNLLINALHATPAGGKIMIHLYSAPPWMCQARQVRGYCISVADTGSGIDPQNRARIFEPFFTTKGETGTGLGLWVCLGVIQRAGGSMRLWSTRRRPRSGTCFSIFLPEKSACLPLRTAKRLAASHSDRQSALPQAM